MLSMYRIDVESNFKIGHRDTPNRNITHSRTHSTNQSTNQSINQSINQLINHLFDSCHRAHNDCLVFQISTVEEGKAIRYFGQA